MNSKSFFFGLIILTYKLRFECKVTILTSDTFDEFIAGNEIVFLKVFSKNCGHCKKAEGPFDRISNKYQKEGINFADIDGELYPSIYEKLQMKGFPGIYLFVNGFSNRLQYLGAVSETKYFESFLDEIVAKKEIENYSNEAIKNLRLSESYTGYGVFCGQTDIPVFKRFFSSYLILHEFKVFKTLEAEICMRYHINDEQLAFQRVSGNIVVLKNILEVADLKTQLRFMKYDYINRFQKEMFIDAIADHIPLLIYADKQYDSNKLKALETFYVRFPRNRLIALHNRFETDFEKEYFQIFGIEEEELPVLLIVEIKSPILKFKYEGNWAPDSILEFVKRYFDQQAPRHLKTQKITPTKIGHVNHITSGSMYEFLSDKNTWKVVLFYTENCHGCSDLKTTLGKVSETMNSNKSIKFGMIDTDKNEVPDISRVPALGVFNKDFEEKPAFFKGEAQHDEIVQFIKKQAVDLVDTGL